MESVKWGSSVVGSPGGKVTWSFAATAGQFYAFDYAILDPSYRQLVSAAFQEWEDVANIDFVESMIRLPRTFA